MEEKLNKAKGVMLGQACGDALGATLEFSAAKDNLKKYGKQGLREMVGAGPFNLLPGQITDDTELAYGLARTLVKHGYDPDKVAQAYVRWKHSQPFDCGTTCSNAFGINMTDIQTKGFNYKTLIERAKNRITSQSNGALMRISPLAIYGHSMSDNNLINLAFLDASMSHINMVCQISNAAFILAIKSGINGVDREGMYETALKFAKRYQEATPEVLNALLKANEERPELCRHQIGWVLKALQNAFYELLYGKSFEDSLVHTVMAGGDTDTNGCIAGALLGSYYGPDHIPNRWIQTVINCKTSRPQEYQSQDILKLATDIFNKDSEQ